jgi:hypothetical protein
LPDEEQEDIDFIAPEATSPEAFDVKTAWGVQVAVDEKGKPVFDFVPQDDEEKAWCVLLPYIPRKQWKDYAPEILFYGAGVILPNKKNMRFFTFTRPIYSTDQMQMRVIVYTLAHMAYENPISIDLVFFASLGKKEKMRRSLLCSFKKGLNILPSNGRFRKDHRYVQILKWQPESKKSFISALQILQSYGILRMENDGKGIRKYGNQNITLTEFGKIIVRLHRENHFLF